jgi:hypothetical protein
MEAEMATYYFHVPLFRFRANGVPQPKCPSLARNGNLRQARSATPYQAAADVIMILIEYIITKDNYICLSYSLADKNKRKTIIADSTFPGVSKGPPPTG